ncbi:MAG TPA: hypothetical protein VMV75_05615 [Sulfuricella sp.]|nr:hypothetical protein [Sulfuricella sp.]
MEFINTMGFTKMTHAQNTRWIVPLTMAACLLFIPGCASTSTSTSTSHKHDDAQQEVVSPGYRTERKYSTTSLRENWQYGDTTLDVALIAPSEHGIFPLIIYLPGLGESANGGILWRNTWAEAGYAVLSVQPTTLGEAVWASSQARNADFHALSREYFSQSALEARLKVVDYVIGETRRRAKTGMSGYAKLDMTRVAIAGFDLGAQTASIIAGEKPKFANIRTGAWNVRAAITLSPYANLADGGLEQRYAAMTMPLLSITGTEDADPLDVTSPSLRRAPWQYMPGGDKYLLLLEGGTHGLLAGSGMIDKNSPRETPSGGRKGKRGSGGGYTDGAMWREADFGGSGGGRRHGGHSSENSGGERDSERNNPQTFNIKHIAAVQSVSTAFLDATVKSDPIAREWLTRNATQWLGDSAVLQGK